MVTGSSSAIRSWSSDSAELEKGADIVSPSAQTWSFEIVRGREVGRIYPVAPGPNVLGSALKGEPGIDLGEQEPTGSPRRMAAKQARADRSPTGLSLVDLDSPGGTFVNRQRLLPGQARRLEPGDLIQLGGVQLKVVTESETPSNVPKPIAPSTVNGQHGPPAKPFVAQTSGATCRTWDDFLTLSAKSWTDLRVELQSGRLAAYLESIGRMDLVPATATTSTKSPDERLDDWLGRLPATRPALPALDVHPALLRVKAVAGGGMTRTKIVITNTGYRLLRATLRLEPAETKWVHLAGDFAGKTFTVAETVAIPIDVETPETLDAPRFAFLNIEGNGGSRQIEIRVELPIQPEALPETDVGAASGRTVGDLLSRVAPGRRIVGTVLGMVGLRGLIVAGNMVAGFLKLGDGSRPTLAGSAGLLAALGALAAWAFAAKKGESRDVPPAMFAGAIAGVLIAAVGLAISGAVESSTGGLVWNFLVWMTLGVVAGLATLWVVPFEAREGARP